MTKIIKTIKTDDDVVRVLRQLDDLLDRVRGLKGEIEYSDHPKAAQIAAALDDECVPLAWPSHVAHPHLEHPDHWATGAHEIRSKVPASKARKGQLINVLGTVVRVARREKWNPTDVKITFEDVGHGLPKAGPNNSYTLHSSLFKLQDLLEVV